jgi:AcrR family transcriptional regulator
MIPTDTGRVSWRPQRSSLSRETLVETAFDLAADISVSNMSTAGLAELLDVPVRTMRWYFRTTDDLLDAMADRAVEGYGLATPFTEVVPWRVALETHCRRVYTLFRSDRVLCDLVVVRPNYYSANADLRAWERFGRVAHKLGESGFTSAAAFEVCRSLATHVRVSCVVQGLSRGGSSRVGVLDQPVAERGVTSMFSRIGSAGSSLISGHDRNFEFTLEAILHYAETLLTG